MSDRDRLWMAVILALALAPAACAGEAPGTADAESVEELRQLERQLAESKVTIDRLEDELEAERSRLAPELSRGAEAEELARCRDDLAYAHETYDQARESVAMAVREAEARREGLERCVAQLNDVSASRRIIVGQGSGGGVAPTYTPPPAAPRSAPSIRIPQPRTPRAVRTLSAPDVQIVDEDVLVSARLWNPDEAEQTVTIEIALLADGVQQDSRTQQVLVPAHGDLAVSGRFHLRGMYEGKTLAGRVRVVG